MRKPLRIEWNHTLERSCMEDDLFEFISVAPLLGGVSLNKRFPLLLEWFSLFSSGFGFSWENFTLCASNIIHLNRRISICNGWIAWVHGKNTGVFNLEVSGSCPGQSKVFFKFTLFQMGVLCKHFPYCLLRPKCKSQTLELGASWAGPSSILPLP